MPGARTLPGSGTQRDRRGGRASPRGAALCGDTAAMAEPLGSALSHPVPAETAKHPALRGPAAWPLEEVSTGEKRQPGHSQLCQVPPQTETLFQGSSIFLLAL